MRAVLPEVFEAMTNEADDQKPWGTVTAAAEMTTKPNATPLSVAMTFRRPSATAKPTQIAAIAISPRA